MKLPAPPYTLMEIRRILSAYGRLRVGNETISPRVWRDEFRPLLEQVAQAADELHSDFDIALKNALWMADENVQDAAYRELYGESNDELDQSLDETFDWRPAWEILGKLTEDTSWRGTLQGLRDGRINLREALKKHPSVGKALRLGVLSTRQQENLDPNWLHGLEKSARARRIAIQAVLDDKASKNLPGPKARPQIFDFVAKLIEILEPLSGAKVTSSISEPAQRGQIARDPVHSPGIEFIYACLKPLYPHATTTSVAGYIETAILRKSEKRHL